MTSNSLVNVRESVKLNDTCYANAINVRSNGISKLICICAEMPENRVPKVFLSTITYTKSSQNAFARG